MLEGSWGILGGKTDEAKAFRQKLLRRPIALRGDTEHFQPNMLGKVVRYLDGVDEPLINSIQIILRATMGGRSVASAGHCHPAIVVSRSGLSIP